MASQLIPKLLSFTPDSDCFFNTIPENSRRLAWDAVSFCVPDRWELTIYKFLRRGVSRIEMEDEYSVRLEGEWTRRSKRIDYDRIMERYSEASKPLTLKAEIKQELKDLPHGWHATRFVFMATDSPAGKDDLQFTPHELVTCFYLCPKSSLFGFFILYFFPDDKLDAVHVTRQFVQTFQNHDLAKQIPWQLFDIRFALPRPFALIKTHFDIGMKLMIFCFRRRRLFLWHLACADVILNGNDAPEKWVCGFLNSSKQLKAPVFYPDGKGGIAWRRRMPYVLGHREEIWHGCYQYDVGYRLLNDRNQLVIWVYHHRHANDLRYVAASH